MRSGIVCRKASGAAHFVKLATLLLTLCKTSGPAAFGQTADAMAELSLVNGATTYHSGEPVRLSITYRQNGSDCYLVSDTVPSRMDHIELTPSAGVFRWQEGDGAGTDASGWGKLEAGKLATSTLTLNDLFRFDEAGDYTVRVRTNHLHCGPFSSAPATELVTNAVTFHVEPFQVADERRIAQHLERGIRAARDQQEAERLAQGLDYLPGDDATRAKIDLTLHPKLFYPFGINVSRGLWIARNRDLIVSALQAALYDSDVFFGADLIQTLVELQTEPKSPQVSCCVSSGSVDPRKATLYADYLHQLARSLSSRSGDNLVDTALTVFSADAHAKAAERAIAADTQAAREILISHFAEINEYQVGTLLQQYGPELADEKLLPALQTLATTSTGIFSGNRSAALDEIHRITSPSGMDQYVAKEACNDSPLQIRDVLKLTDVGTVPSVDACLQARLDATLKAPPDARSRWALESTLTYVARFADGALVPEVAKAYSTRAIGDRWSQAARGAAICYLTRWNAPHAKETLEAVLPGGSEEDRFVMSGVTEVALPSNVLLRSVLRERIAGAANPSDYMVYDLSQVGSEEDRLFLAQQLKRFHESHQPPYSQEEGRLESELVAAQIRGRSWDLSGERAKEVSSRECQTDECKRTFSVQ